MGIHVHIDLPAGFLIANLGQRCGGWIATERPLAPSDIAFLADGVPLSVEFHERSDAARAMPRKSVIGWSLILDREHTARTSRILTLEVRVGGRVAHVRRFYTSQLLKPPGAGGPLCFMHIPKTAGTALRHFVDYAFSTLPALLVYGERPGVSVPEARTTYRELARSRELLFGHFDYAFASDICRGEPRIVATIRPPRELVESYLNFERTPAENFLDNPLVRHFCGDVKTLPFGAITRAHLDLALERARRCLILRHDRLQAFADEVTELFGLAPYRMSRVNETATTALAWTKTLPVDVHYDEVFYGECCERTRSLRDFLSG